MMNPIRDEPKLPQLGALQIFRLHLVLGAFPKLEGDRSEKQLSRPRTRNGSAL